MLQRERERESARIIGGECKKYSMVEISDTFHILSILIEYDGVETVILNSICSSFCVHVVYCYTHTWQWTEQLEENSV